jgi:ABC-type multidrug transport system ATPase subunit/ABC-type multidrug transport system permease subunit
MDIITWRDLNYSVETKTQGRLQILDSVSGTAKSGRLLAIMGSSGSGKTTLLDCLCGRVMGGSLSGSISMNGEDVKRLQASYVPQQDLLLNTATVRETFETAALLRDFTITRAELDSRIESILEDLGLKHREHALIGGGEVRGLSGGEKRRTSIGQELVSSQSRILCLDEPTTGLDSSTAESVMSCLKDLAHRKGIIVICTIHQPNSTITALFDDFILLSGGRVAYCGVFNEAVERFSNCGFKCPMYCNPTDYYIRVVGDRASADTLVSAERTFWKEKYLHISQKVSSSLSTTDFVDTKPTWSFYRSFFEIRILTQRAFRQWFRDPGMFLSELIQYIFLALFFGGMYAGSMTLDYENGVFSRCACIFFVLSILLFTPPFTAIQTFALERPLFLKEKKDKLYKTSSWIIAKSLATYPIEGLLCLIFSAIAYFMVGFQYRADKFFLFYAMLLLLQLCAESTGLLFSSGTSSPTYAIIWMSLILIVVLSLTGFLTTNMPSYYRWIEDSNILRFTMQGLLLIEFDGLIFTKDDGSKVYGINAIPSTLYPDNSLGEYFAIMIGALVILKMLTVFCLVLQDDTHWFTQLIFGSGNIDNVVTKSTPEVSAANLVEHANERVISATEDCPGCHNLTGVI